MGRGSRNKSASASSETVSRGLLAVIVLLWARSWVRDVRKAPEGVEDAFLAVNYRISPDNVTLERRLEG